jgi:hypothetical protein
LEAPELEVECIESLRLFLPLASEWQSTIECIFKPKL